MSAVGDARKRLHPSPLTHHDPAVRDLIAQARAEGVAEGKRQAPPERDVVWDLCVNLTILGLFVLALVVTR